MALKQKYTKEQIQAIDDLIKEFAKVAHTMGENERLREAKANLLNRNVVSLSAQLLKSISQ